MIELLYAFLLGLLGVLSPCTFVIVPVIAAQAGSRFHRILKFMLGVVIIFTLLGALASLTGQLLTNFFIAGYLYLFAGIITLLSGLDLLQVIRFPFPTLFSMTRTKRPFIMGLLFGGVALGCIGPLLGAVLAFIVAKALFGLGLLIMLAFSLGFALPFVLFGFILTDKTTTKKLMKHMVLIRNIGGFMLLGVSVYLLFLGVRGLL